MKHTMSWVKENCNPFVTYDDNFQIWKHKTKEEYWAYDEDEEMFIQVELVAIERFPENQDEFKLMNKYENDWCGEVDGSYGYLEDNKIMGYDYAWFKAIK